MISKSSSTLRTGTLQVMMIIVCCLILASCKTYFISTESLKQQFSGVDSAKLRDVTVRGPAYEIYHYKANPLEVIHCADEKGVPFQLKVSPSIEMRVTYGHSQRRSVFYFDRTLIYKNSLLGVQSRFMDYIKTEIPLDSITKIEVQDGHKKFTYVNPK